MLTHFSATRAVPIAIAMALLLIGMIAPGSANATVVRHADIDRLTEISHLIVHGIIEDASVEVDDEARWLLTSVAIEEIFANDNSVADGDRLIIRQWAGHTASSRGRIAGDARLEPGDEVVLFLRRDPDRPGWTLAGLSQAVFYVQGSGLDRRVRRRLEGLHFISGQEDTPALASHEEPRHHWNDFLAVLERALQAHHQGGVR